MSADLICDTSTIKKKHGEAIWVELLKELNAVLRTAIKMQSDQLLEKKLTKQA
jgi:hypothetical protein